MWCVLILFVLLLSSAAVSIVRGATEVQMVTARLDPREHLSARPGVYAKESLVNSNGAKSLSKGAKSLHTNHMRLYHAGLEERNARQSLRLKKRTGVVATELRYPYLIQLASSVSIDQIIGRLQMMGSPQQGRPTYIPDATYMVMVSEHDVTELRDTHALISWFALMEPAMKVSPNMRSPVTHVKRVMSSLSETEAVRMDPSTTVGGGDYSQMSDNARRQYLNKQKTEYRKLQQTAKKNGITLESATEAENVTVVTESFDNDAFIVHLHESATEAEILEFITYLPAYFDTATSLVRSSKSDAVRIYSVEHNDDAVAVNDEHRALLYHAPGSRRMRVRMLDMAYRQVAVDWIASHPIVVWLDAEPRVYSQNRWGHRVTQTTAFKTCTGSSCTPFWDAGIQGQGQIIGVGDTGLQLTNCYFRSSTQISTPPFAVGSDCGEVAPSSIEACHPNDTGHSKIRAYWTFGDDADKSGHGTHCSGTAAGRVASGVPTEGTWPASDFNGVAYKARIAFADLQDASMPSSSLAIPGPIDTTYLLWFKAMGASVHSGSWGSGGVTTYTSMDHHTDEFLFENPEFVAVFAAGNAGGSLNTESIISPGNAKNVITVGATMNSEDATRAGSLSSHTELIGSTQFDFAHRADYMTDFSSTGLTYDNRVKPDVVAPGASPIWSAYSHAAGDNCRDVASILGGLSGTSMATPNIAGIVALTRQYFQEGFYPTGAAIQGNALEPTASLIKAVLVNSGQKTRGVHIHSAPNLIEVQRGTTRRTITVKTFDNDQGNSAYFPELFPNGRMGIEGHGAVRLDAVLRLSGHNTNQGWTTLVLSNEAYEFNATTDEYTVCLTRTSAEGAQRDLFITLVWTDYPGAVQASKALVNDLDLEVVGSDGVLYNVNNRRSGADRRNNVESVKIRDRALVASYTVKVRAHDLPFAPSVGQRWSLVATGPVQNEGVSFEVGASCDTITGVSNFAGEHYRKSVGGGDANTYAYNEMQSEVYASFYSEFLRSEYGSNVDIQAPGSSTGGQVALGVILYVVGAGFLAVVVYALLRFRAADEFWIQQH